MDNIKKINTNDHTRDGALTPSYGIREKQGIMRKALIHLAGAMVPESVLKTPTMSLTAGIAILNLGCLTPEMMQRIFPWAQPTELGLIKSKYKRKGEDYFDSKYYHRAKCVYTLNKEGIKFFTSKLLDDEMESIKKGMGAGYMAPNKLWHDIGIRNVPCACLRYSSDVSYKLYSSVILMHGSRPEQRVLASDTDNNGQSKLISPKDIITDAVMIIDKYCILIEEDTASEPIIKLRAKMENYADYFETLEKYDYQLIFNIDIPDDTHDRISSRASICDNIRILMSDNMMTTLHEAEEKIVLLAEKYPDRVRYINMLNLLEDYYESGGNRENGISQLTAFVKNQKTEENEKEKKRAAMIRKSIDDVYKANLKLSKAISQGLSIPVTNDIYRQAYYINPYDSGLLDEIIDRLGIRGAEYDFRKGRCSSVNEKILRNYIVVWHEKKAHSFYMASEISADIAENIRLVEFLKSYKGEFKLPLHILIICASHEEAATFASETKCIRKYCDLKDNTRPFDRYNVILRFTDYSKSGTGIGELYIPQEDGNYLEVYDL
jgi:hypothetical protein